MSATRPSTLNTGLLPHVLLKLENAYAVRTPEGRAGSNRLRLSASGLLGTPVLPGVHHVVQVSCVAMHSTRSGPLNRLNAILSLLQPLDRYRAPSAIESAIGRPYLALSRIHTQAGALNRLVLNRLGGSTAR